jgi:hypothetical protein
MNHKKKKFEDMYDTIDQVIKKRKNKWKLKAITWFDFEDIEQIIKVHIYKKWHLWDQTRAIEPWVNRIVTNQIRNIIRNNYTSFARPCLSCPFNQNKEGDSGAEMSCGFTTSGKQCNECPLFAKWEKVKKSAYDVNDKHFLIYKMFFIDNLTDDQVARILKFKTSEKGRKAGYKQIKNLKKMLYIKAQILLKENDIFST